MRISKRSLVEVPRIRIIMLWGILGVPDLGIPVRTSNKIYFPKYGNLGCHSLWVQGPKQ